MFLDQRFQVFWSYGFAALTIAFYLTFSFYLTLSYFLGKMKKIIYFFIFLLRNNRKEKCE